MDSSLVLCSQSPKRTPSQARGKETPLDTLDSMLLAEKDLVTDKHLCCCGDRGPRGSPSASLESEAGERPQEGPRGSLHPSTYPVCLFSLLKAWLPSLETGQGCTKQAGLSKISRAGEGPLGSPCFLSPNPAPTKYFFSSMCHPIPRKEVSSRSKTVCIGAGVSGRGDSGREKRPSVIQQKERRRRGREGGGGAGESMPDTPPVQSCRARC